MLRLWRSKRLDSLDSLSLFHSWPLFDAEERVGRTQLEALGRMLRDPSDVSSPAATPGIGLWACDITRDNRLLWSPQVYELFGLGQDEPLTRAAAVTCYTPRSRAGMEALRAHAIHHRRGFTLDAMLRRHDGEARWMRLTAMPIIGESKVVRLCGTKEDVTSEYDGPGWRGF
ncbi:MAG: PAS domain-containing protein [Sphingobium sp.]|nr:PAS domain-containing protein [Sphingobium sp.]